MLWDGGSHPKILGMSDYDAMMKSNCLFARKFSSSYDMDVIFKIKGDISEENECK